MAGEESLAASAIFVDTSLIVAATVEAHPSHVPATQYFAQSRADRSCASVFRSVAMATRNAADFRRYGDLIQVDAVG